MDFYALLGVTRAATRPEVERAYRRLQRRYHPGINPGDRTAENLYRQIQEAFDVLGDAERRRLYDAGGPGQSVVADPVVAFEGFDFSAQADGPLAATFSELFADVFHQAAREATTPTQGADVAMAIDVPFIDAMRGCQVPVSVTRLDRCAACGGSGHQRRAAAICEACRGEGIQRWARGHMVFSKPCESCEGTGQTALESCRPCRASGVAPRTEVLTLAVPAGIESGARLVVPSHGHKGARGGPTGDLYVTVHVGVHRQFTRSGRDLHLSVPVTVAEAALGGVIDVPSLDGVIAVTIPPGSGSGRVVRVPGQGVHGADGPGDLVLTLHVTLPDTLDDRARQLLEEFGRRTPADVRRDLFT